jgi:putative addiction module component (TIGR02574 family)
MDNWDSIAAENVSQPGELPLTGEQRREILRRSEAHRRSPGEAIPLDEALDRIERSLK